MEDKTMAAVDPQSKKWQLTINNPQTCGLDRDCLLDILNQFSLDYFALCDEVGANRIPHTHVFLCAHSNLRSFSIDSSFSFCRASSSSSGINSITFIRF